MTIRELGESQRVEAGLSQLRILATSDLHAHVFPYDYYTDRPSDDVGLARTASLIAKARAEIANTLLLDNGDFLQGSPLGDYAASRHRQARRRSHPMVRAMNALHYDAVTIGNHDLDHGVEFLTDALKMANFPTVCANIGFGGQPGGTPAEPLLQPYVLLDRTMLMADGGARLLRVGVVGFLPPQITRWLAAVLGGQAWAEDIVESAARIVPQMRLAGADIVVALAHTGFGAVEARPDMENAATALALVPGIDAVVAGHSHLVFPSPAFLGMPGIDAVAGTVGGKPAVMPGFYGSHLGVIDLDLRHDHHGWRIEAAKSEARPILRRRPDWSAEPLVASAPAVLNAVAEDHAATLGFVRQPIGKSAVELHTYFALVSEPAALRLVAAAQRAQVVEALAGGEYCGLPVLSAVAPFKTGGRGGVGNYSDIPAGDLALRHLADLYLYPNTVHAVKVSGATVATWLERAAGIFRQVLPGQKDQPLIDPDFPSYNFDTITGLTYRIDLSQPNRFEAHGALINPSARRICDLSLNGQPLDPESQMIVATNSYRASGGGAFPGLGKGCATIFESHASSRDLVVRQVIRHGVPYDAAMTWTFKPLPGTSVVFETSPAALRHIDALAHLRIEPAGRAEAGFARFRIRL